MNTVSCRGGHSVESLPEDLVAEVAKLRRENQDLRTTNELLKSTSELNPQR